MSANDKKAILPAMSRNNLKARTTDNDWQQCLAMTPGNDYLAMTRASMTRACSNDWLLLWQQAMIDWLLAMTALRQWLVLMGYDRLWSAMINYDWLLADWHWPVGMGYWIPWCSSYLVTYFVLCHTVYRSGSVSTPSALSFFSAPPIKNMFAINPINQSVLLFFVKPRS